MILVKEDIVGVETGILRPMAIRVGKDIIRNLTLPANTGISINEEKDYNDFTQTTGPVLNINYSTTVDTDLIGTTTVISNDVKPLIKDTDVGLGVKVNYMEDVMNITCRVSNKSKSVINRLRDRLRVMAVDSALFFNHNIKYTYYPKEIVPDLLLETYKLKYKTDNSIGNIVTYLKSISNESLNFTVTEDGDINKADLCFTERHYGVLGALGDGVESIGISEDKETNMWSTEFTYKVEFTRPVGLILAYPILVYNNNLPKRFFDFVDYKENLHAKPVTHSGDALAGLEDLIRKPIINSTYLTIPTFDMYQLPDPTDSVRILSVLTSIDKENPRDLFKITDLPTFAFKESVLEYLRHSCANLSTGLDVLFNIDLYANDTKVNPETIVISEDLTISSTVDLDMTKTYRVGFNIRVDLSKFSKAVGDYIYEHFPEVEKLWFNALEVEVNGSKVLLPRGEYLTTPRHLKLTSIIENKHNHVRTEVL